MSLPGTSAKMETVRGQRTILAYRKSQNATLIGRMHDSLGENAFTLIELLVVITIIVVLMGLLFPAFRGVQDQAKKTQAKNDLTQIVTAVNAYYTEYGKYPVVADDTPILNSADLFYTLRALALGTANAGDAANPRKIVFLNPPDAKDQNAPRSGIKTADGQWYDPWGSTYKIAIDGDYDNQITPNPYGPNNGAGSSPLRQGAIAWSLGKDTSMGTNGNNVFTNSDDVISWQ
jgi:prepilin-type N-terminal cleavage/methylation domain-containing protein